MDSISQKSNLDYWKKIIHTSEPLIKDWFKKEKIYLKTNIKKDSIVLDVGCGFGRDIILLTKIAKEIVGIDNDRKLFLEINKELSKYKNVKIFLEDAKKMHFCNDFFDYVICMGNTFGNLGKDQVQILKEMKRVTKEGGRIIISVYSEKALNIRIKEYRRVKVKIKKVKDGKFYSIEGITSEQFTKEKLKRIFKSAGLKNFKIINLNPISYLCEIDV